MRPRTRGALAVVCAVSAVGIFILGAGALYDAHTSARRLADARQANPLDLTADLSRPGTYEGKLTQIFSGSHAQVVTLATSPPFSSAEQALRALEGLDARLRMTGPDGAVVLERTVQPENVFVTESANGGPHCILVRFNPFGEGPYDVTLTVEAPAAGLAGRPHSLESAYEFCGLEGLAVLFGRVIGGACVVVGLAAAYAARRLARRRAQN